MTIPFDLEGPSCSSLRKARVLRQTELRRCWFNEASKDDKQANTRLGTLRFLPYEIRQQIFKIVLEDYVDEYNLQRKWYGDTWLRAEGLTKWQLSYEGWYCRCGNAEHDVFTLASYSHITQYDKRAPLNLRFASESLEQEFDRVFLASNTFEFNSPASLERFMGMLSPLQQRQLKCIKLHTFGDGYWVYSSDMQKLFKAWMAVCERLPPGLISVQFILSHQRWWRVSLRGYWAGNRRDRGFVDGFGLLSKKVSRACPRAQISLTGREEMCKEVNDVLDAMLQELEPWSKEWLEWHEWMDRGE